MKAIYFIAAVLFLTGCQFQNIEITGTAPGMDGATVSIVDAGDKIIYGTNIQGGKFNIVQQVLNETGYYILQVNKPGVDVPRKFEIYLEPGKYNIALSADKKAGYPIIKCTSKTQTDLSVYYHFADSLNRHSNAKMDSLNNALDAANAKNYPNTVINSLYEKIGLEETEQKTGGGTAILDKFVNKYPNNSIIMHVFADRSYESNPLKYYSIYKKLSTANRTNAEGRKIGEKLISLINLLPGKLAPALTGATPDGNKIDIKAMHKKIILVEFWRSGSITNRENHRDMLTAMLPQINNKGLGIISVSFDTDKNDWTTAIKDDKLYWPQVSDLKGDDSPNILNWNVAQLPMYYLLTGDGHIIESDVEYRRIRFFVTDYLAKH